MPAVQCGTTAHAAIGQVSQMVWFLVTLLETLFWRVVFATAAAIFKTLREPTTAVA